MKKTSGATRLLCVSIACHTMDQTLAVMQAAASNADLLEIRLDGLVAPDCAALVKAAPKPLLFTNRPVWEQGAWRGVEDSRVLLLQEAVRAGGAYVDLELRADLELRDRLLQTVRDQDAQLVLSWHDFTGTPSSKALESIFQEQYRSGAHIGKIVTMANSFQDVLRVLALQSLAAEMDFPLAAFCMGRAGMISRVATLELGGCMTYAAPDDGAKTAPGQLAAGVLRRILQDIDHAD